MLTADKPEAAGAPTLPGQPAYADAARIWLEVAKNEETRFNNLNTRGVAVITIAGLVTTLAGFFAKDLPTSASVGTGVKHGVVILFVAALAALAFAATIVLVRVLWPKRRALFGDNLLVKNPGQLQSADDVLELQITEFSQIALTLQQRNADKARGLEASYAFVVIAIWLIAVAAMVFAIDAVY